MDVVRKYETKSQRDMEINMEENVSIPKSNLYRFIWSNLNQDTPVEEVEYKTHKRKVGDKW